MDAYYKLAEIGIIGHEDKVELINGEIMNKRPSKFLFDVNDYYKMAEVGIIGHDDKVELIKGEIVYMSPSSSMHAHVVNILNRMYSKSIIDSFLLSIQNPLFISKFSQPEPDVLIVKNKSYKDDHPTSSDVLILIEVSASTLKTDQTTKKDLYAEAKIQEYWIVNLVDKQVEVYTGPENGTYQKAEIFGLEDTVKGKVVNVMVQVKELFE